MEFKSVVPSLWIKNEIFVRLEVQETQGVFANGEPILCSEQATGVLDGESL
jgi:hypothetical protein